MFESGSLFAILAVIELAASVAAAVCLVHLFRKLSHTTTMGSPGALSAFTLIPSAFLVASVINPGEWLSFTAQVLVAFTMYVEAVALVPQLYLIRKMDDVEALTSHYIALLVIARVLRMLFWLVMFSQGQWFICLFVADLLHTAMSADYLYLWIKKLRHGGRLVYSL
jgi:ER lumen protein retaining receptor